MGLLPLSLSALSLDFNASLMTYVKGVIQIEFKETKDCIYVDKVV